MSILLDVLRWDHHSMQLTDAYFGHLKSII